MTPLSTMLSPPPLLLLLAALCQASSTPLAPALPLPLAPPSAPPPPLPPELLTGRACACRSCTVDAPVIRHSRLQVASPGYQPLLEALVAQQLAKLPPAVVTWIEYGGQGGEVGEYVITALLQEPMSGLSTCFCMKYVIEDVDECSSSSRCHHSASCLAIPSSYECVCDTANGDFGVEGSGSTDRILVNNDLTSDVEETWTKDQLQFSWTPWQSPWPSNRKIIKTRPQVDQQKEKVAGRCGGEGSTADCCWTSCKENFPGIRNAPRNIWKACLKLCKEDFQCSNDPCRAVNGVENLCAPDAVCIPSSIEYSYSCQCREGYVGDGFECKQVVQARSATPDYCSMSQHVVWLGDSRRRPEAVEGHTCSDSCMCINIGGSENGYRCKASMGFIAISNPFRLPLPPDHVARAATSSHRSDYPIPLSFHHRLDDNNECFRLDGLDLVQLEGPAIVTMQQGQLYEELGVRIHWKARTLHCRYIYSTSFAAASDTVSGGTNPDSNFLYNHSGRAIEGIHVHYPFSFASSISSIGTYNVVYTVSTPWLFPSVSSIALTRVIVVTDLNECLYTGNVSEFLPDCDPLATCENTMGSFNCICPLGFAGDGRLGDKHDGCRDVIPPVLRCHGVGCSNIRFSAFNFSGLVGLDVTDSPEHSTSTVPRLFKVPFASDSAGGFAIDSLRELLDNNKYSACGIRWVNVNGTTQVESENNNCFHAYDHIAAAGGRHVMLRQTSLSSASLTSRVHMGSMEAVGPSVGPRAGHLFRVVCNVQDDAGNEAEPLFLHFEVEYLDVAAVVSRSETVFTILKVFTVVSVPLVLLTTVLVGDETILSWPKKDHRPTSRISGAAVVKTGGTTLSFESSDTVAYQHSPLLYKKTSSRARGITHIKLAEASWVDRTPLYSDGRDGPQAPIISPKQRYAKGKTCERNDSHPPRYMTRLRCKTENQPCE